MTKLEYVTREDTGELVSVTVNRKEYGRGQFQEATFHVLGCILGDIHRLADRLGVPELEPLSTSASSEQEGK